MAKKRQCESGLPSCGPPTKEDSEGVPLCERCYYELLAEAQGRPWAALPPSRDFPEKYPPAPVVEEVPNAHP